MIEMFTKEDFLKISEDVLNFYDDSVGMLKLEKDAMRKGFVLLNNDRNYFTFHTIRYLAKVERVADIYTLSRAMFESVINMGLITKSLIDNDIERYQSFPFIESYKIYNHLKKIELENLSGITSEEYEYLRKHRYKYEAKWNKLSTWSGNNLEQNVILVDKNYPATWGIQHFYEYLYCQVYRKGSQVVHSSFGGLMKGINIDELIQDDGEKVKVFIPDQENLVFACFHSLFVFLSSMRFLGISIGNKEFEIYNQKMMIT